MLCYLFILFMILQPKQSLSIDLAGIYNMDRVNSLILSLNVISSIDYNLNNKTLNETESNQDFKKILRDLTNELENLNLIASASEDNYWPNDFYAFIKTLGDHQVKIGYTESFLNLESHIKQIEKKRSSIDAIVRSLIFFRRNNYFDSYAHFCPYFMGFLDFVQNDHYDKSISSVYEDFLRALRTKTANENRQNFCGKTSSFRVGLFNFFRCVMTPFLKKYTMVRFAQIAETRCNNRSVLSVPLGEFEIEYANALRLTKELIDDVLHYTYRCDAKNINPNNKQFYYHEMEKMIQTVIIEERFLNVMDSCSYNCDMSQLTGLINRTECSEFQDCRYLNFGYNICKSDDKSSRRYEWFAGRRSDRLFDEFGETNNQQCIGKLITRGSYYSPSRVRDCDFCICICISNSNPLKPYQQINYISFRAQTSDITQNKIVVGVKFVKKDNMIHVQIKEGTANPNGVIMNSEWKPLENFHQDHKSFRYFVEVNGNLRTLKLGTDFGRPEGMNFDDLIAPKGFVVTGVRFGSAGGSSLQLRATRVQLLIRVTPFNFISGKLEDLHQTYWVSENSVKNREELVLNSPDISWKATKNFIVSKTDMFVKFRASDLKKDAGQSTVPFLDAQDVIGDPEYPVGGVGIIHRGHDGFGGFLAFRIFDINFSKYFKGYN